MFKRKSSFSVCFSFCPNGEPKSVLIAQTHGQKVILYLPSVVPSFVYLLLNCLRRTAVVFCVTDCWGGGGLPEEGVGTLVWFHFDVPVSIQWDHPRLLKEPDFFQKSAFCIDPVFFSTDPLTRRHSHNFLAAFISVLLHCQEWPPPSGLAQTCECKSLPWLRGSCPQGGSQRAPSCRALGLPHSGPKCVGSFSPLSNLRTRSHF